MKNYAYVASPYSHEEPEIRIRRYEQVRDVCARLLKAGMFIYSPIVHSHPIAIEHDLPKDAEYWKELNIRMLRPAGLLIVVELPGWEESLGVRWEIETARTLGIPIMYIRTQI